ncbi:MAG: SDR family NAD(P)-dependent oxidoreductase [Actinomycetota bacterium]
MKTGVGVEILTKVLASEIAPYGINVNAISIGTVMTEMAKSLITEERRKQKLRYVSMNRFGFPKDISNVVLFLSSKFSDYITGAVIPVDGGLLSTQNPWMAWDKTSEE